MNNKYGNTSVRDMLICQNGTRALAKRKLGDGVKERNVTSRSRPIEDFLKYDPEFGTRRACRVSVRHIAGVSVHASGACLPTRARATLSKYERRARVEFAQGGHGNFPKRSSNRRPLSPRSDILGEPPPLFFSACIAAMQPASAASLSRKIGSRPRRTPIGTAAAPARLAESRKKARIRDPELAFPDYRTPASNAPPVAKIHLPPLIYRLIGPVKNDDSCDERVTAPLLIPGVHREITRQVN